MLPTCIKMDISEWLHFSVDDVIECFQWIYKNKPNSIFDEPMLQKLKKWRKQYNLQCDLYVFEQCEGFSLSQLQDCYWQELRRESHWLKMAWHAPDAGTDMGNIQIGTKNEKKVLASLERVYKLVTTKIGQQAWSNIVRLHLWTAPEAVLSSLHEKGTNVLLTADRECTSYHLKKEDLEILAVQGKAWVEPFQYRVTDIRFDWLDEGISVQELLDRSEKCLKRYLMKPCLEVFVHSWKFEKIVSDMDAYMERFGEIQLPLAAEAGVVVGKTFYFTTCNTYGLYAMDMVRKETRLLAILPCKGWNLWKFVSLCHYQGTIWMIPWMEDKILSYHLKSGKTVSYQMPFLDNKKPWLSRFRNVIEDGKFLWLLPSVTKKIIRIDMECHSFETYSQWPGELIFRSNDGVNFLMQCRYGRKLYLLKQSASHNVIFDMDTGKMEVWGKELPVAFGIVTGNDLILSPRKSRDPIRIYNMETGTKKEYFLPDWVWDSKISRSHAFWHIKRIRDSLYIFPHDANVILLYNTKFRNMKWIELKKLDYAMDNTENYKGVSAAWEVEQKLYFLSFLNNIIITADQEGNILEYIYLIAPVKALTSVRIDRTEVRLEFPDNFLMDFLYQITSWENGKWQEVKDDNCIGELIYNEIKPKV